MVREEKQRKACKQHQLGTILAAFNRRYFIGCGVQLSLGQRLLQWLLPVNPSAYQSLGPKLRADLKREGLLLASDV